MLQQADSDLKTQWKMKLLLRDDGSVDSVEGELITLTDFDPFSIGLQQASNIALLVISMCFCHVATLVRSKCRAGNAYHEGTTRWCSGRKKAARSWPRRSAVQA